MPGVVVVPESTVLGRAIDDLELLIEAMPAGEIAFRVVYLPSR